jgi:CRP-like cAMP-binding protein
LRREGRAWRCRRGQALFAEGDLGERVFVLERGWILLSCLGPGGREIVLDVRGPGEILGELSALDGRPRSASAIALDDIEATIAPASALNRALEDPAAAKQLIGILAARLRDADRSRIELASTNTLARVARRLQELGERFGQPTPEGLTVALALSQEQLASWCGASRDATVRALATLRALQIITTSRHRVLIQNPDALHRQATGQA